MSFSRQHNHYDFSAYSISHGATDQVFCHFCTANCGCSWWAILHVENPKLIHLTSIHASITS